MMIISIATIAIITYLLRLTPFILFGKHQETPKWIVYIGGYLPPAVMGMLIIYSIKNTDVFQLDQIAPLAIAILITALFHLWRRNNLISILTGTVSYMLLIQVIFI